MRQKRRLIILLVLAMLTSIGILIRHSMVTSYAAYCQGITEKILTSTEVKNELSWELEYKTTVQAIVAQMAKTENYTYPITVNDLKDLNMPYLYCRGHNTYLRGTGTNTITRSGSLGDYTITTITGKGDNIGSYTHEEVDVYSEESEELTFNEWGHFGREVDTAANLYNKLDKIFHVPGINGDAEENDDHYCEEDQFGNEYAYGVEYETATMSRYYIEEEESLYTDETTSGYKAYDAAKSYILTVVKGGHYGPGQVAFWRLKDTLGLTGWEGKKEVHTIAEDVVINKLGFDTNSLYQIVEITAETVEQETEEQPDINIPEPDGYEEETIDYDTKYLSGGDAGVLFQEAITLGKHVYATEEFKKAHEEQLMADCTNFENLNVNYVKNGDYYLVGPFNIEYIRTVMKSTSSLIDAVKDSTDNIYSFGGITGAKLKYETMNGDTKYLTVGTIEGEAVEANDGFEFIITDETPVNRSFDTAYQFPYPGEDFYLKVPYQGEDEKDAIKYLKGLEYTFDNSYGEGKVYNLLGVHYKVTWSANYEGFKCEETASYCDSHHITPGGHCYSDCSFSIYSHNCGHESTEQECQGFVGNDRDPEESGSASYYTQKSCSDHWHHFTDEDGKHSGCYSCTCTHSNECEEEATRCETHHYTVGDTHYRNRSYWLEPEVDTNPSDSQPLMWMEYAEVHRRTYTATSEFEVDMTMDFGGFVWVDAYTNTDDIGEYTGDNVYDPEKTALSGYYTKDILKEGVEVYLLKVAKAAGAAEETRATGTVYVPENGNDDTTKTIGDTATGYTYYYAEKPGGGKITATTGTDGKYSFDEIPVLKGAIYEGYVVAFVYDGQTYESVEALYKKSDDGTTQDIDGYVTSADKTAFYNSSMATEDDAEREKFNEKFKEIYGQQDIDIEKEETIGSATQVLNLEYESKKGSEWVAEQTGENVNTDYLKKEFEHGKIVSILDTEGENGVALDGMKMDARTSETSIGSGKGLIYPLTDVYNIRLVDKQTTSLSGTNVTTSGEISHPSIEAVYDSAAKAYTANINLGLIIRPQADISVTKDLYSARTVIKGNDMTYAYGEALRNEEAKGYGLVGTTGSEWPDTNKVQEEIMNKNIFYNLYLYKADYEYNSAVEYISASDAIKEVRMGRYATTEGFVTDGDGGPLLYNSSRPATNCIICNVDGTSLCDKHKAQGYDSELRTYLTYKITIRNEGAASVLAGINNLIDYHDDSLEIISQDVYAVLNNGERQMLDENGNPNIQLVATGSQYYHYKAGETTADKSGAVSWTKLSETITGAPIKTSGFAKDAGEVVYVQENTNSLKDVLLAKNEKIEIYVTYRVKEKNTSVTLAKDPESELLTDRDKRLDGSNGYKIGMLDECGRIILGDKYNIAEIGKYSTYILKEKVNTDGTKTSECVNYGRVDKDSAPDNINLADGDKAHYDDDGDAAPPIKIKLLEPGSGNTESVIKPNSNSTLTVDEEENNSRTITGVVWEDERTEKITEYQQLVGNGKYDEATEVGIEGITVQLIEKVQTMDGTEEDYLPPDIKEPNATYKKGDPVDNTPDCISKFETKTDASGTYVFTHIPAGTYVVRFIYGSEKIETQYAKMDENAIVKYGDVEVKASEMPQTYNGQDFKSTSYQVGIDNDTDDDGYIDNEFDNIQLSNLGKRLSDARDSEVRRLENIAYSRTVNNKVATELDALSDNNEEILNYEFSVGILNGTPTVMIQKELDDVGGKIPNSQIQAVTQDSNGNYTISRNEDLIEQDLLLPNVMQYTWMYADTAKINIGAENDVVTKEIVISETYSSEYLSKLANLIGGETINYSGNAVELAKLMLKPITHEQRIIEVADINIAKTELSKAAIIYNVLPGQITTEGESNFSISQGEVEKKYEESSTGGSSSSEKITNYPSVNRIYNIDFGIEERPKNSVELEKWVSSLELKLSDGRILFNIPFKPEYNPETGIYDSVIDEENCISDVYDTSSKEGRDGLLAHLQSQDSVKYFGKEGIAQGFIYVNMDEELLQGATITVGYGMMVTNTSEVDTVGLLSFFDDGDTIMQLANYIREASEKNMTTPFIGSTIGSLGNSGTSFLSDVREKYEAEKAVAVAAVTTEVEKQFISTKYDNVISRLKSAEDKLINLMVNDKDNRKNFAISTVVNLKDQMNGYIINNPTIDNTNNKKTTPYGLFVGTTYYTGEAAKHGAKVYAVESKVEQIIDYVDNQLGADDSKLMALNGSWTKLDITALFGNYVQNNVLNSVNPSGISNEGTLINIFESAVISFSNELLNEIKPDNVWDDGNYKWKSNSDTDIETMYRTVYEKLLAGLAESGNQITLRELIHSLGDEGIKLLSNIYNIYMSEDTENQELKNLLELIISGLTVTDNEGNSYITMSINDLNELRNNVLITVNDKERNPSLGTYLVPEKVAKETSNLYGTNDGYGFETEDIEGTTIKNAIGGNKQYSANVNLVAQKTVSATALAEEIEDMVFNNAAEIVQISNKVGRKDKMAVAGNLLIGEGEWESTTGSDPSDGDPITKRITAILTTPTPIMPEYDSAATARIIFSPPTGQGFLKLISNDIFQGGLIGLIIVALGIVVIKVVFFKKKKIYK